MIAWLKNLLGLKPLPPVVQEPYDDSKERAICMNQPVITQKQSKPKKEPNIIRAPQYKKRPGRPRKKTNA